MIEIFTNIDQIDKISWRKFVYDHPEGNIFQTPEMFEVYKATKNYNPIIVICYNCLSKEIDGILLAVIQQTYRGVIGFFTKRSIVLGGPLIKDNNTLVLNEIFYSYNKYIKYRAIYSQIRNLFNSSSYRTIFEQYLYRYEEHLNILIDLKKNEDQLWNEINSKRKNEIRRAIKSGTTVKEVHSMSDFRSTYLILKEVYQRAKLPFPDYSLFNNCFSLLYPEGLMKVFCAYSDGNVIGTMITLSYKNVLYDWYAGSYKTFYNKYPNDLIPWVVFITGKKHGFEIFDFGGAGNPHKPYKVRDYKKQFGGEMVNFGRYEKVHQKYFFGLVKLGFKVWQKLRK